MKKTVEKGPLVSICITSYNRVNELKRCLESIDIKNTDEVEIIVSEDCSPKKDAIRKVAKEFEQNSKYKVVFNSNEKNLGYDRNLGKLVDLATGKYVVFISDDDSFIPNALDAVIEKLSVRNYPVVFTPFYNRGSKRYDRKFKHDFDIQPTIGNVGKHIYSSILFSGLIFERNKIMLYNSEEFLNLMYYQVYLFCNVLYKHGGSYFDIPLVDCIGDGENAFGISDSSLKNDLLADRKSTLSNLEYHKGLIKVIRKFDEDNNVDVERMFAKEYSIRSYTGLERARRNSARELKNYWNTMNKLDIKLHWVAWVYYFVLLVAGNKLSNYLFNVPKSILIKLRHRMK